MDLLLLLAMAGEDRLFEYFRLIKKKEIWPDFY